MMNRIVPRILTRHALVIGVVVVSALGMMELIGDASAAYPARRIEVVPAGAAGGGLDAAARSLERALRETQLFTGPLIINNMTGGAGDVAKNYVHNKKGDPHVLYLESNRIFQNKILGATPLDFDNFVPLARLVTEYLVWVVRAESPHRSARDILDLVKSDPASVPFGVGSMPSNDYFNVLRPALMSGADYKKMRVAAFRGNNLLVQVLGGHVPVISTTASEALEHVRSGKARLLVTSAPTPQGGDLKGVPTWRSLGIDMHILHWRGLFMPLGVPRDAVAYWDERLAKLMKTTAWQKVLEQHGWADAFAGSAPFRRELEAEREVTSKLLKTLEFSK